MTRQVVLDTETTGLEASAGHRIIEIGCVELVNRRPTRKTFHRYVNPERAVDAGALDVHGIDDDFLAEQPRFCDVADEFLEFVRDAELVIHNADFDVDFINHELRRLHNERGAEGATPEIGDCCRVLDTLALARRMHPGQRNSLDALARRYSVDNSKRELHGALLDAQILADIYLAMTGGQVSLLLDGQSEHEAGEVMLAARVARDGLVLPVLSASEQEESAHAAFLERIRLKSGKPTAWERLFAVVERLVDPLGCESPGTSGARDGGDRRHDRGPAGLLDRGNAADLLDKGNPAQQLERANAADRAQGDRAQGDRAQGDRTQGDRAGAVERAEPALTPQFAPLPA